MRHLIINSSGNIQQNNIYYPLGGTTALSSGQDYQQYKYTDKEYDPMHGLNQYDLGAREIIRKKVKVPSAEVDRIRHEAERRSNEFEGSKVQAQPI